MVKINAADTALPVIVIDAGIHAREWISPASVMYFVQVEYQVILYQL